MTTTRRVAILGYAFRLPGSDRGQFWPDLLSGRDFVTRVADDRWSTDAYLHPHKSHPGTSYTFAAGSIGDAFAFDAEFFSMSPREAAQVDPQQRLLLELTWEAMENAGIRPADIRGSRCGVFIGISTGGYCLRYADDLAAVDSSVATGTSNSIAANRISYAFDLQGPSLAVDTACSSSLVAFHLACRSILSGESEQALAGGMSLHLHPYEFVMFSKASMLSKRGSCSVFDASGDGYVRSEGGGVFLLKDYDRALADGDRILAVVANTRVNTDGRKSGLTVPSARAQADLLASSYAEAGIAPAAIDYIEAHGTGTAVGDPVETQALGEALGRHRPTGSPLLIGSVKSNLGHLEAAAGVAGLVKALHCLEHRTVPATIHFSEPNPKIPFDEWNLRVVTEPTPLKRSGQLVVGINSFGFGGANAHVILESPAPRIAARPEPVPDAPLPVLVSGRTEDALRAAALNLSRHLRANPDAGLYDVAYATVYRREWLGQRAIVVAGDTASLAEALDAVAGGTPAALPVEKGAAVAAPGETGFIYTGNGAAWEGMGARLMAEEPAFRDAVLEVDEIFQRAGGGSILEALANDAEPGRYRYAEIAQPALFAIQVGITQLMRARGIAPAAVAGHSVGEVAAAWACGALSLEQAVHVIYHRSRLQGATLGEGQMTAVALGEDGARETLERLGLGEALTLAAVNSSQSVTVSGPAPALARLEAEMVRLQVRCLRLDLDYAFHSAAMDPIEGRIVQALRGLAPAATRIPFHSTVTGEPAQGPELGARYWWRNVREPVRFDRAIAGMVEQGVRVFVEIGPHALLRSHVATCLRDCNAQGRVVATLERGNDSPDLLWSAVWQAAIAGAAMDWKAYFPRRGAFVELPNYPWQRSRYKHTVSPESYQRLHRSREHPLLGYRLHEVEWGWENQLDTQLQPALADHVIGETTVLPGTGFVEMALAAAHLWHGNEILEVEHLEIRSPLVLDATQSRVVQVLIEAADGAVVVRSREHAAPASWTQHASGRITREPSGTTLQIAPLELPLRAPDFTGADHDELAGAVGLAYGPAFRALDAVWVENGVACARFRVPEAIEHELAGMHLHPALLDCAFQLIIELLKDDYLARADTVYVPAKMSGIVLRSGAARPHAARARLLRRNPHSLTAEFAIFDAAGAPICAVREVRLQSVRMRRSPRDRLRYLDYHGIPSPHPRSPAGAPRALFEDLRRHFTALSRAGAGRRSLQRYAGEIEPLLDELCSRFAVRALKSLAAGRGAFTRADLAEWMDTNPEAAHLLLRLIDMLEQDAALAATADGWRFVDQPDMPEPEDIWNSMVADYPDYHRVFHAVGRVGMRLPDLLAGRCALEQLLPRDCTPSRLAGQLLADAGLYAMERALQDLVAQALARLPEGKRFRLVELGMGGPTFGSALCAALDFDRCDYVFLCSGPVMPEDALRLQERYPRVEARLIEAQLDGEAPTPSEAEQFQLAIVNAGFATEPEASSTLDHAGRSLCSGGSLLVVEQHQSRWMDFVFGGRRTWWTRAQDGPRAPGHEPTQYRRQHMQNLGFPEGAVFELSAEGASGPYVVLFRKAKRAENAPDPIQPAARTWLVLADRDGFSGELAGQLARTLEAHGGCAVHASPGSRLVRLSPVNYQLDPTNASQFERLLVELREAYGRIDGIVHLYGLSAARAPGDSLLLLERQVDRCAAAATLARAADLSATKTCCWLVTGRAARSWLPNNNRRPRKFDAAEAADNALWGFGRTLMNEATPLDVRLVDVDPATPADTIAYIVAREMYHPDAEQEIALTATGARYVPRLRLEAPPGARGEAATDARSARLGLQFPGQLRNLRWESHPRAAAGDDELEIEVRATGLNFRDVMLSLGLLSDDVLEGGFAGASLGLEFSGVVLAAGSAVRGYAPGDRVVGFAPMSFAERVVTRAQCVATIPAGLTFEAAATIPSAFLTAHYALNRLARIEKGERVLIHGAAGGVGIAAIQLAFACGAVVFATAGSEEKRDYLRLLGVDHVFDSRSLAFADEILAVTGGEGVDIVLNSLAGEAINRNLRVLRPLGRFLELGKRDFQENTKVGLRPFRNNISYYGIDVDQLIAERPGMAQALFQEVISLFSEGVLHPLPYQGFEAQEVVDAFRHMQQSRHIGKIVVTYRHGVNAVPPTQQAPRMLELPADATYLVTGGLRGFGLKAAERLAARGARNLVLVSRSGPVAPEAKAALAELERAGVKVLAAACDVTDRRALATLLSEIAVILPPLRGIVHAATTIEDGLVRNTTRGQIRRVLAPKVMGAQHLHQLTLGKALDFFVLFSSATTLFGNPGQGSYVAANAWLEAIAVSRREAGLPALCVRLGAIGDAGFLARNTAVRDALLGRMGGQALDSGVALDAIEELLLADRSGVGVLEFDWRALGRFLPAAASPKFSEVALNTDDARVDEDGGQDVRRLLETLPAANAEAAFMDILKAEVGEILRVAPDKIDEHRSIYEMGFDSLMGVELVTAVEARFNVRLSVLALGESPTIAGLCARVLRQLAGTDSAAAEEAPAEQARRIAIQHGVEADAEDYMRTAEDLQSGDYAGTGRLIQ